MKIQTKPVLRFEHSYRGKVTVLEGAELGRLIEAFIKLMNRRTSKMEPMEKVVRASLAAYEKVHGGQLEDEELRSLKSADARKVDLFFRGVCRVLSEISSDMEKKKKKARKSTKLG